ncbi:MAG: ArsR/SmtB family transcription factor [Gammaproteobacteria bacterium]
MNASTHGTAPRSGAPSPQVDLSEFEQLARLNKALGHPVRLALLKYLADHGTCYFGKLTDIVPLAASTVSQHVSILKEAGLIAAQADQNRVCYCVQPAVLAQLKKLVAKL